MLHVEIVEAACAAGQARLLREARRRDTRADCARRSRSPRRGCDHRGRLQLPLRAARAVRGRAAPQRPPRRDHELPWPLLLDVRQRSARSAELAFRAGRGRLRRLLRPAQPRSRPGSHADRPDLAGRGHPGDVDRRAAAPAAGRRRTTVAAPPATRPGRSPTRTTSAFSLCSRTAPKASSSRLGRWSAPRARWPSTSTAPRARSRGTSSG